MSMHDWLARIAAVGKRDAIDTELAEEMAEHLRALEDEYVARGMSVREARDAARRSFGNATLARQRSRESWGFDSLDAWVADVRFGIRVLRKRWPSTVIAVLALAIGIGATTAAMSALDAVLNRRYVYAEPERIALLWAKNVRDPGYSEGNVSPAEARLWARSAHGITISSFGFEHSANVVALGGAAVRVTSASVSTDLLSVLGVRPMLGRDFTAEDARDAAGNLVLVSYSFWQGALGANVGALGATIVVDRQPYVVAGVLPRDFELPTAGDIPLLLPIRDAQWRDVASRTMTVVGRMSDGVTPTSIEAQLTPVSKYFTEPLAAERGKWTVNVETLAYFGSWTAKTFKPFIALAWLVLLIACTNVAILLLARIPARERELAIRAALGAGPRRLFRQLCIESALIVGAGAAVGLFLSHLGGRLLAPIGSASNYQVHPTVISPVVIGTLVCAAATCLIFGLAPVFNALRRLRERPAALIGGGRDGGRSDRARLRTALIVVEATMSVILLTIGALMVESAARMRDIDVGFDGRGLVTARVTLDTLRYRDSSSRREFFSTVVARLAAHGELHGATAGTMIPLASGGWSTSAVVRPDRGARTDTIDANTVAVLPGYFAALRIPLIAGSDFAGERDEHSIIINDNLARRLWPGEQAVGKRLRVLEPTVTGPYAPTVGERTVVAVVKSPPLALASEKARTFSVIYLPSTEIASRTMYLAVHASTVDAGASAIRREVGALDGQLPVFSVASIDDLANVWLGSLKQGETIGAVLAVIGLALTLIGIYSVVAVLVAQRTREIGIRLAVGARGADVVFMVMRRTLAAAGVGSAFGVVAFRALSRGSAQRLLGELLYETPLTDSRALVGAVVLLAVVMFAAAFTAARRAAALDPLTALRAE